MLNRQISTFFFACFGLLLCFHATAQRFVAEGRVINSDSGQPVPYVTVGANGLNKGTRTDEFGRFKISTPTKPKTLKFNCVGFVAETVDVPKDSLHFTVLVVLSPKTELLKEVEIRPKKYKNKDNPAVELIELVIKNRDNNRVEKLQYFQEDQYEKVMLGFSNISQKTINRKILKSWKFAMENQDTTKLKDGSGVVPGYLLENLQTFYSSASPKRKKIIVNATKTVRFPLMDGDAIEQWTQYLYQDIDLYDNYVVLLTDHFLSPIANNAPLFYRYYPTDTIIENGSKIVKLLFFPRNKTDMLLQGELYIALDSTYPVTKAIFTISEDINLNWVKSMDLEQHFAKTPEGKWLVSEEDYKMDFGLGQRGMGVFGERYVSHRDPVVNQPVSDTIFEKRFEARKILEGSEKKSADFWDQNRHTTLSKAETNTYANMDSLQNTKLFKNLSKTIFILAIGHWRPTPGIEIGRINTFYAFNPVEGNRYRFGGRTRPELSTRFNVEGYVAYGDKDKNWKYGIAANFAMGKGAYNTFPVNVLRINYQQDLRVPAIETNALAVSNLGTSVVRGINDRFFFLKRFGLEYEKEYANKFSYIVGVEHRDITPLGALKFIPTDEIIKEGAPVVAAKAFFQIRYAPGEVYYQTKTGYRARIKFNYIAQLRYARGVSGVFGSQYNFDEVVATFYKFSNTPPIGYNFFYIEAGGVFGKVPYPLLSVHRANQSYAYKYQQYNLMNFMEFVSDRYIAVNIEHQFYGFFTNKIPLVKKLKLREFATVKVLYGQVSKQNQPVPGSGLYELPKYEDGIPLTYTLEKKPYIEASVGLGNIFKLVRIDLVRRFTYLDNPNVNRLGLRGTLHFQF